MSKYEIISVTSKLLLLLEKFSNDWIKVQKEHFHGEQGKIIFLLNQKCLRSKSKFFVCRSCLLVPRIPSFWIIYKKYFFHCWKNKIRNNCLCILFFLFLWIVTKLTKATFQCQVNQQLDDFLIHWRFIFGQEIARFSSNYWF